MSKSPVAEAMKKLRVAAGHTQQSFAQQLELAISTVVRYETSRPPRGEELARFLQLAAERQLHDVVAVFAKALEEELKPIRGRIPRNREESVLMDLLLLTIRTSGTIDGGHERRNKLVGILANSFDPISRKFRELRENPLVKTTLRRIEESGELPNESPVWYGVTRADLDSLGAEIEALKREAPQKEKGETKK